MEKWKWSGDGRSVRDSWDSTKLSFEKDRDYGFSWPQRNYRCSFCKREFKSAQALGGHMNVHRRERASMRLSSPNSLPDSPNPNPNIPILSPTAAKVISSTSTACHSSFSCVSKPAFPGSPDQELHLGPVHAKQRTGYFPFENVPVIERSQTTREICGGDRGKRKNKGAMLEVAIRKDAWLLKTGDDELMRLDLSMGFVEDHAAKKDQDLDLELRLGYC